MPATIEASALEDAIAQEGQLAACFVADWCGYCRTFSPAFVEADAAPWAKVFVDISEDDPAWDAHSVQVVPTVVFYREGKEVHRIQGVLRRADLDAALARTT